MESNDLYYSLSTIAQVLAATTALVGAFSFFRINRVFDFLIGTGKAVFDRAEEKGYDLDKKYKDRLRDSISRKDVSGIKEVIKFLSEKEAEQGHTKKTKPRGLQFLYEDWFCTTARYLRTLNQRTKWAVISSLGSIVASTVSLAFIGSLSCTGWQSVILISNQLLFVVAMFLTFRLLYHGLITKTAFEEFRGDSKN